VKIAKNPCGFTKTVTEAVWNAPPEEAETWTL
jgi:hypothetical protein